MSKGQLRQLSDEAERDCPFHPWLAAALRQTAAEIDTDDRHAWGVWARALKEELDELIAQARKLVRISEIVREAARVCAEAAERERVPASPGASEGRGDGTE